MIDIAAVNLEAAISRILEISRALQGYIPGYDLVAASEDTETRLFVNGIASLNLCIEWMLLLLRNREASADLDSDLESDILSLYDPNADRNNGAQANEPERPA